MAFPRPQYDGRSPPDSAHEKHRSSWESPFSSNALRSHPPPSIRSSTSTMPPSNAMDPESSDSDISVTTFSDSYRYGSPPAVPAPLPPPPSKHALESSDAVQARLRELSRVEDHNIKKTERLTAKRRRKDDKIARKRDIQDRKIKAIMDARERRDARIAVRRAREDAAFKKVDDQVEEEEMSLRRRLKRLKRGLPLDESPRPGTSMSSASMSPPGPSFSTIPPPAKRHQSGPPGQQNSPRTIPHSTLPPPPPNGPPAPQYSFYQSNHQPYSVPYHTNSAYQPAPPNNLPSTTPSGPPRPNHTTPNDRNSFGMNGRPPSPLPRTVQTAAPNHTPSPANSQPRQVSSSYDTKPPPTTSGFASINAPPASGFAAINPRSADTPPSSHTTIAQPPEGPAGTTPLNARVGDSAANDSRTYGYNGTPTSTTLNSTPGTGKRTPSTTHPYQMSEAFANRHHHCERVDSLNRGIWTSYGPMGTQDAPTGPAVEMYLRCNHDECRRIDWRTVHGLQCHIVKNHEQPKGTIGSLEKALVRYGVPVAEVEDYERTHGEGSAGTMADPKNLKIKNKTREASAGRAPSHKTTPGSYGIDPTARPAGYKPSPSYNMDSPSVTSATGQSPTTSTPSSAYGQSISANSSRPPTLQAPTPPGPIAPPTQAETVRSGWADPRTNDVSSSHGTELSKLQGDSVMRDAPQSSSAPHTKQSPTTPYSTPGFWKYGPANNKSFPPKDPTYEWRKNYAANNFQMPPPPAAPPKPTAVPKSPKTVQNDSLPKTLAATPTAPTPTSPQISKPSPVLPDAAPDRAEAAADKQDKVEVGSNPSTTVTQENDSKSSALSNQKDAEPEKGNTAEIRDGEKENVGGHALAGQEAPPAEKIGAKKDEVEEKENHTAKPVNEIPKEDGITSPITTSRRSTMQSPVATTKPLPNPGSARRGSRRSSMARKLSGDGDVENAPISAATASTEQKESEKLADANKDEDDGDSITVASSTTTTTTKKEDSLKERDREPPRTPPRRNTAGRFTRRSKAG